jgi:23S rRNA (cytidine1920-2'-O)/16S rRNA (cytidine1409-2'-O)-methyltransferase
LLQRRAKLVIAVDVGRNQLHASLRGRSDVLSMEQTDIRTLASSSLPLPPELAVVDVSFISLRLVLPAITALAAAEARLVALVKPQFEAGPERVTKGIVRDPAVHAAVCKDVEELATSLGWRVAGIILSPIEGGDGNREFLLGAQRS